MPERIPFRLLAVCAALIFIGRGYGYIFWGSPIRVLVWDQDIMEPVVVFFGSDWEAFASDLRVDDALSLVTQTIGVYFVLCGLVALAAVRSVRRWFVPLLTLGAILLLGHALLEMKDHFYYYAQFFEHAIQVGTPLLLVGLLRGASADRLLTTIRIVVALTFAAHGLYAIGFYDVPAHFVNMTMGILGVGESTARTFLWWAGFLDLIVAVGVFIPRVARWAFAYAVVWGLLTALARVVYGWNFGDVAASVHGYLYQTVFRLPHGLVPLVGWLMVKCRAHTVKES